MPSSTSAGARLRLQEFFLCVVLLLGLGACAVTPAPAPPAIVAPALARPAPEPTLPAPADPADLAARRLLAYAEKLRPMNPEQLAAEIAQRSVGVPAADGSAPPDAVLALALALSEQHNPGDLPRAASLLQAITGSSSNALQPWRPLANLLADRLAEQQRLEDQLDRLGAQHREAQRTIQQLTEKLEALKAIERSMNSRAAPGAVGDPPAPGRAP